MSKQVGHLRDRKSGRSFAFKNLVNIGSLLFLFARFSKFNILRLNLFQ